jgi:predicted transcriptional regulator
MHYAEKVKNVMALNILTLTELATKSGVSYKTLQRALDGDRKIRKSTLRKILCDGCGLTKEQIFSEGLLEGLFEN